MQKRRKILLKLYRNIYVHCVFGIKKPLHILLLHMCVHEVHNLSIYLSNFDVKPYKCKIVGLHVFVVLQVILINNNNGNNN